MLRQLDYSISSSKNPWLLENALSSELPNNIYTFSVLIHMPEIKLIGAHKFIWLWFLSTYTNLGKIIRTQVRI